MAGAPLRSNQQRKGNTFMPNLNSHTPGTKPPTAEEAEPRKAPHEPAAQSLQSLAEKSVFSTPTQRLPIMTTPDLDVSSTNTKNQADAAKNAKQSKPPSKDAPLNQELADSSKEVAATASHVVDTAKHAVADSSKEVATTASHVVDTAKHAVAEGKEQLGSAASEVVTRVESAAEKVKERGEELLHSAAEQASELYDSASETVHEVADSAGELARGAGRSLLRASESSARFVGSHALPLTAVGLSLAWLTWSIRSQSNPSRRVVDVSYAPTRARRAATLRADDRTPVTRPLGANVTDGTTTSPKLMGARAIDRDLGY